MRLPSLVELFWLCAFEHKRRLRESGRRGVGPTCRYGPQGPSHRPRGRAAWRVHEPRVSLRARRRPRTTTASRRSFFIPTRAYLRAPPWFRLGRFLSSAAASCVDYDAHRRQGSGLFAAGPIGNDASLPNRRGSGPCCILSQDDTPGCRKRVRSVILGRSLKNIGVRVFGISTDPVKKPCQIRRQVQVAVPGSSPTKKKMVRSLRRLGQEEIHGPGIYGPIAFLFSSIRMGGSPRSMRA